MAGSERAEAGEKPEAEGKPARSLADVEAEMERVKAELAECRGTECEVYARIVGYYRSVKQWNAGKREEFGERKVFVENPRETAERLEAAMERESRPLSRCSHPGLAWKCPNSRAGGCAREGGQCPVEASMAEACPCGNEAIAGAHIEKEAAT